jgi:hypothetical protein
VAVYEIKHDSTILDENPHRRTKVAPCKSRLKQAQRRKLNAHAPPWQRRGIVTKSAGDAFKDRISRARFTI